MVHPITPKPSPLLEGLMHKAELTEEQPVSAKVTFLKVVFDLQQENTLKTIILFRCEQSDGVAFTQARSCTVEKQFTPMDVMMAIAQGDLPPVWAWPHLEEGFV